MAGVVAQIKTVIDAANLPSGFSATLRGTFQAQEEASRAICLLSLISLGTVFAILYGSYRSTVCVPIIIGAACAATLLPDGKPVRTPLVPATAGVLSGDTGVTVPEAVNGAVQFTDPEGKTVQAKF